MINLASEQDCIQLSLPLNAAYVSSARLTASSVANRMGFATDEIEDIKAAVSEACTYIIKKMPPHPKNNFQIQFYMEKDVLAIHIQIQGILTDDSSEMGLVMIKALMDQVEITSADQNTMIEMSKNHKANIF